MDMKTLLVPTDFSETANNALDYAGQVALAAKARIVLLHVNQLTYVSPEAPLFIPVDTNAEENAKELLDKNANTIRKKYGTMIQVDRVFRTGFAVEEIMLLANELKPDLVVMGMQGAGFLAEKLIGSVTSSVIEQSKYPVLVIGKNTSFKQLKNIVFAYDYVQLKNKKVIDPLKNLAQLFNAHIYILGVNPPMEEVAVPKIEEAAAGIRLDHLLEENAHSFHYAENEKVIEGIQDFVASKNADLVAMVPHRHSFFNKLFHEPNTKKMAFHTSTPLLTLPE
jgi:nucleotide-binding universal stress UspA family protein